MQLSLPPLSWRCSHLSLGTHSHSVPGSGGKAVTALYQAPFLRPRIVYFTGMQPQRDLSKNDLLLKTVQEVLQYFFLQHFSKAFP